MHSNGPKPAELNIPGVKPASSLPLYDLLISSRKYGRGSTSQADAPILWWKLAGRPKETPPRPCSLVDPVIQARLAAYELVDTEVQANQIIRRYRKLCGPCGAPGETELAEHLETK